MAIERTLHRVIKPIMGGEPVDTWTTHAIVATRLDRRARVATVTVMSFASHEALVDMAQGVNALRIPPLDFTAAELGFGDEAEMAPTLSQLYVAVDAHPTFLAQFEEI